MMVSNASALPDRSRAADVILGHEALRQSARAGTGPTHRCAPHAVTPRSRSRAHTRTWPLARVAPRGIGFAVQQVVAPSQFLAV
jgi:hypothetical protein